MAAATASWRRCVEPQRPLRKIDPHSLPTAITERGWLSGRSPFLAGLLLVTVCAFFFIVFLAWDLTDAPGGVLLVMFPFLLLGVGLLAYGLMRVLRKRVISLDAKAVAVMEKSLSGTWHWAEPLANYKGVLLREETRRRDDEDIKVHLLELHHGNPEKSISLYESTEAGEALKHWATFCARLGLPALEIDNDRVVKKPAADLAKSVHELVEEGKERIELDLSVPPPGGLSAEVVGDSLVVTVVARRPYSPKQCLGAAAWAISLAFGIVVRDSTMLSVLGFVAALASALSVLIARFSKERVKIRKGVIHLLSERPWGESSGEELHASQIRSVTIDQGGREVVVRTDEALLTLGDGLRKDALEWLKNCIKAAASA